MIKYNQDVGGHNWTFEIDGINNRFSGQATINEPCFSWKVYPEPGLLFITEKSVIDYLTERIISENNTYSHPQDKGQKIGSTCYLCKRQIQSGEGIFGLRE